MSIHLRDFQTHRKQFLRWHRMPTRRIPYTAILQTLESFCIRVPSVATLASKLCLALETMLLDLITAHPVFPPHPAVLAIYLIVAVSVVLMLLRPRNIPEVYWIAAGVVLLLLLRLIPPSLAARAIAKGTDVYLFLTGMMILSELGREHGLFDWLSSYAVRHARHSSARLFFLVYAIGTVVTIFLSNDATAVVLTPAIFAAVRKARVEPMPYLFACAFVANAASFVLPISNPANLVVFRGAMPVLARWLLWFAVPSMISIAVTFLVLRCIFRRELQDSMPEDGGDGRLNHFGKLVLAGLAATVLVLLLASWKGWDLGLPTFLTAAFITAVISILAGRNPVPLLREISWSTLALVVGLFVLVDAVESVGAMDYTRRWLAWASSLHPVTGTVLTGSVVGVANNLVNNLPLGLIAGSTLQSTHVTAWISSAVLIGVDLGPNLSITGSLATILWLIALRRENLHVDFWSFLKVGTIAMPVALLSTLLAAVLMHWIFV